MWMSAVFVFAEMCLYCSRIFREEIRWGTFSGLFMLPGSFLLTIYSKWAGCLLGLAPACFYFFLGHHLNPKDFDDLWDSAFDHVWPLYIPLQFLLGFHLCAFLSLFIKYGSVALSVAIVFVGNILLTMMVAVLFRSQADESVAIFGCVMTLFATLLLHIATIRRAYHVAAQ